MTTEKERKKVSKIIWALCILIAIGAFGIPHLYQNYHSAPNFHATGRTIILENKDTHKLNEYQRQQFIKIAKRTVDIKDGPFNWKNYKVISLDLYKTDKQAEYAIIFKIRPKIRDNNSILTNSMVIKLKHRNLIDYYNYSIKQYSSSFSNMFSESK